MNYHQSVCLLNRQYIQINCFKIYKMHNKIHLGLLASNLEMSFIGLIFVQFSDSLIYSSYIITCNKEKMVVVSHLFSFMEKFQERV